MRSPMHCDAPAWQRNESNICRLADRSRSKEICEFGRTLAAGVGELLAFTATLPTSGLPTPIGASAVPLSVEGDVYLLRPGITADRSRNAPFTIFNSNDTA